MSSKYQKIIEHSKEGLLVANTSGVIETVNPRIVSLFGYDNENELLGQKVEILIPVHLGKKHVHHRESFNNNPTSRTMGTGKNLSAVRKDGSEFPVEVSLSHYDDAGELKIIAFVVDITKRAEIEAKLLRLNTQLENEVQSRIKEINTQNKLLISIAQNFPNGNIYVINNDYIIEWADGKLIREMGLNDRSLVGLSFKNRLPDNLKGSISEQLERLFNGENIQYEVTEDEHHFSIYGVPLSDNKKDVMTALLVELDTTIEKKMKLEMQQNLEQEKKLNEMKSRFVSMASHEFRTPLSTIVSSATLIGKYEKEGQQKNREKHIDRIKRSVSNLTSILNDFLSLEKLESGAFNMNPVKLNIPSFIDELLEEFSVVKKDQQTLTPVLDITQEWVNIDPVILKNCCLNLLSNASKYSSDTGQIWLTISSKKEELRLSIKDEGIGIPKNEQEYLFSRFFRAKNVTNIQGTGLGLNIVKRYVDLMDGKISFKSELEKGTEFTISIMH